MGMVSLISKNFGNPAKEGTTGSQHLQITRNRTKSEVFFHFQRQNPTLASAQTPNGTYLQ
jgi:hypothetical protein